MKFNIKLTGDKGYVRAMGEIQKRTGPAARRSVQGPAGQAVLKATIPLTPVKSGALRASGRVTPGRDAGGRFTADVTFGSPSVPYARRQHEELSYAHPGGGQAKYLQEGARRAQGAATAKLMADVAVAWKGSMKR